LTNSIIWGFIISVILAFLKGEFRTEFRGHP
jgi:hypothetical protein